MINLNKKPERHHMARLQLLVMFGNPKLHPEDKKAIQAALDYIAELETVTASLSNPNGS